MFDSVLLQSKNVETFESWKKIELNGQAFTNAENRNYAYLLSLLGVMGVELVKKEGIKFLIIGDLDFEVQEDV